MSSIRAVLIILSLCFGVTTIAATPTTAVASGIGAEVPLSDKDLKTEDLHSGKRCRFTKLEAIVTGVAWFLGGVPGAIMTPLACKKDLFQGGGSK